MAEILRFIANGLFATLIHFAVLVLCIEALTFPSAALANLVGVMAGIAVSFLGSRYFVFRRNTGTMGWQAVNFVVLYVGIAFIHAVILLLWTDILTLDYRVGFVLASGLAAAFSYWGNRTLVFAE
jgi:putative flippase GtrA